jgi:hypothetical protein
MSQRTIAKSPLSARSITTGVRAPVVHELKCWPVFFDAIAAGRKRHDLRRISDRDFRVGDRMRLREFDPKAERYTGREQIVEITYLTSAEQPCALSRGALHNDFCVLSIARIHDA